MAEEKKNGTETQSGGNVQVEAVPLVKQVAELLKEDQSARKQPPTLLYTDDGAMQMAKQIVALMK